MALPIKHHNKRSKGNRRSHHALKKVNLTKCSKCGEPVKPHYMCKACGNYNGRTVVNTAKRAEKALKSAKSGAAAGGKKTSKKKEA